MATSSNGLSSRKTSTEIQAEIQTVKMMMKLTDALSFPFVICQEKKCPYNRGILCYNPEAYKEERRALLCIKTGECRWKER